MTRRLIEEGGAFSVSLLARADRALVRRFVKPVDDVELDAAGVAVSLQGEPVHEVAGGLPVPVRGGGLAGLLRCGRSLAGTGRRWTTAASHVLFVGEVVDAGETGDRPVTPAATGRRRASSMEDTRMNYGG